jgi:hypothetical protein
VDAVECFCLSCAQLCVLQSNYSETSLDDVVKDFSGMSVGYGIRLNHGKSAVGVHEYQSLFA